MDPRLLRAYNEELLYLRESAREFGEEHGVVAGRLGPNFPDEPDPYVERLLEGVAFMCARVKLKLDDEFPDFTQHLLRAIQPNYVAPTPSMGVVEFEPEDTDPGLAQGAKVPRHAEVSATPPHHETPCRFRTGTSVHLWPLKIAEAEYLSTRAAVAPFAAFANIRADAGLRLVIEATGPAKLSEIPIANLPLFLAGGEDVPGELYRQLLGEAVAVVARGPKGLRSLGKPRPYGFDDESALLPDDGRSFRGYRLLTEYFACPERFLFVDLPDLDVAFHDSGERCEICILFSRSATALQGAVSPETLRPFCAPVINLFELQLDRTQIKPYHHEHLVMADRTRPLDYEVFRLLETVAYDDTGAAHELAPLYAFGSLLYDWRRAVFYVPRLRMRRISTKEQRVRRRSEYIGSETWISLVSPEAPERVDRMREVAVRALVTNRELPELLRLGGRGGELTLPEGPLRGANFVRSPTRPRPPLGLADAAWRVVAHLTPNYASFLAPGNDSAALLRDHLALYGRTDEPTMRRQVDGVLHLEGRPVTRRVPGVDGFALARGQQIRVRLDDSAFENARLYLFAAVLDRFLAEFASVNTFVETVFSTSDRGDFAAWPPRMGLRPTI